MTIKRVQPHRIADCLSFDKHDILPIFKHFLARGDVGYYAYIEGACVHRAWVQHYGQYMHLHRRLILPIACNQVFIHFCETSPAYRNQGIYAAVLSKIANAYSDQEVTVASLANNNASMCGIKKAGYKQYARCSVTIILGMSFKKITRLN